MGIRGIDQPKLADGRRYHRLREAVKGERSHVRADVIRARKLPPSCPKFDTGAPSNPRNQSVERRRRVERPATADQLAPVNPVEVERHETTGPDQRRTASSPRGKRPGRRSDAPAGPPG